MEVHRELGPGLREICYQRALSIELAVRGIAHSQEVPIPVWYRGQSLGTFRADIACGPVLVEVKALPHSAPDSIHQLAHYLTSSGKPIGLLLNFGRRSLEFKRVFPRRSAIAGPARIR
jgi:GxxExxY protein